MAKGLTILADMRREEQYKSLTELSDRDMCEMIRAHFESHPTLPGEKTMKDQVNQLIAILNPQETSSEPEAGWKPADQTPFENDSLLAAEDKEELARRYAQTRIRETHLKEGNYYLDFRHFDPTALKRDSLLLPETATDTLYVDRVNVELQKNDSGEVFVMAEQSDGGIRMIGTLPENFLMNNPMNVNSCRAELQIADYSNGKMKNLSARVVVDTDLMSGDVVDLDEDLLRGLDQTNGLEQ